MMDRKEYQKYISKETLMGPSSVCILEELINRNPLKLKPEDVVLDLGCGKGLTSLVIAKETGAKVLADDLWIKAEENESRFVQWGVGDKITPVCADANALSFEPKSFKALFSVDAYHYFAGQTGFFEEKLLPFLADGAEVLIGVPGMKEDYAKQADELMAPWLGEEAYMFKSPKTWAGIIGSHARIESVETWEMDCFEEAWNEWFATEHPYAQGDRKFFDELIKPYSCFVGMHIKIKG